MGVIEDQLILILAALAQKPDLFTREPNDYSVMVRNDQPPSSGTDQYQIDAVDMAANTLLLRNGSGDIAGVKVTGLTVENSPAIGDFLMLELADGTLAYCDIGNLPGGTPSAHAASHTDGTDDIQSATAAQKGLATAAQITKLDGIETGADVTDAANVTAAGALMDSEVDADIKTLALPANTTISAFGATLVDDASAAAARTTLDVDQAGTDNSTNVTLAGTPDYITLAGQVLTRNPVDLTADVTGDLPIAEGGTGQSTAQAAIDALTQVSGATNEHVLTKDTGTGNAIFKAAAGGSSLPVDDTTAIVQDPADNTKTMKIDVGAVTTGTNRTLTMSDSDFNMGLLTSVNQYRVLGHNTTSSGMIEALDYEDLSRIIIPPPQRPFSVHINDTGGELHGHFHDAGGANVNYLYGAQIKASHSTETIDMFFKIPAYTPAHIDYPKLLIVGIAEAGASENTQFDMSYASCTPGASGDAYDTTLKTSTSNTMTVSWTTSNNKKFMEGKMNFTETTPAGVGVVNEGDYLACQLTFLTASTLSDTSTWNFWLIWE